MTLRHGPLWLWITYLDLMYVCNCTRHYPDKTHEKDRYGSLSSQAQQNAPYHKDNIIRNQILYIFDVNVNIIVKKWYAVV